VQDPTAKVFELALGLTPPWYVDRIEFDQDRHRLDIGLDFRRGARFSCPVEGCGRSGCPVHDTEDKAWRHLNFFQHECYLHARVPRVSCPDHGAHLIGVPWARGGSGFTLLFEGLVMALVREMPVLAAARLIGEHDTRIWRIVHHYVEEARAEEDFSGVTKVGVDDTSSRRGQNYITQFVDLERSKTLFATEGRDHTTVERFAEDLRRHGGDPERVQEFSLDMSAAYMLGIEGSFKKAELTFDKFHVAQLLSQAMDEVRRTEQEGAPELKQTRWLWLKSPSKLTKGQQEELERLRQGHTQTAKAYEFKLQFQDFWNQDPDVAPHYLDDWCNRVFVTDMPAHEPLLRFVGTVDQHWDGIVRWFQSRVNNGMLEAINGLIQAAKRRARGYRTTKYLIDMVYLTAGKLSLPDFHGALAPGAAVTHTK
jgi:transposase